MMPRPKRGSLTPNAELINLGTRKSKKISQDCQKHDEHFPETNHWGFTFAQDKSGKQFLVMLEGPAVPQDILEELCLSQSQLKEPHASQDEEFQDFPHKVERSKTPVTLVSSRNLKPKRLSNSGTGDAEMKKTKGKSKRRRKSPPAVVMDSAGDASSLLSSDVSLTNKPEAVPRWMDDVVANFIRSNRKSRRLEREVGMRSCTRWLRHHSRKHERRRTSSASSVGDDSSGADDFVTLRRPSFSPLYSELGEKKIRFYPDFSQYFGEVPTVTRRPTRKHFIDDDLRNQSFDFIHSDCDSEHESSPPPNLIPTFAKFDNPKLQKALGRLSQLENLRVHKEYHVPPKTPLYLCSKGGTPPEGRRAETSKGYPVGPFYTCPIDHISGIVLRRPKIKKAKRAKPFDSGRRPHFLPFRRDFQRMKEGKDCCSCDKWKGCLGVGNIFDADQYHQNYLNCVTYNQEAQLPCKSDRCERCRLLTRPGTVGVKRLKVKKKTAGFLKTQRLLRAPLHSASIKTTVTLPESATVKPATATKKANKKTSNSDSANKKPGWRMY